MRVITTNGTVKRNGECVMGRGCAAEAKKMVPGIASLLGDYISRDGNQPYFLGTFMGTVIYSFPVKHSWYEKADLTLIGDSAYQLLNLLGDDGYEEESIIVLPRPGCGNGGLRWSDVKPILEPILDDRFHVITFG